MRFAGAVKQFLRDIRSVVGLPSSKDLAGQTLGDGPALALVRLGAAVHRREMEFVAIHQQNAGLDAAKIHRNAMNDRVEEFVELKDGSDLLRRLLQRKQRVHAALLENRGGWRNGKLAGSTA